MATLKTTKTSVSAEDFLAQVPDEQTRQDCHALSQLMQDITGAPPKMWGSSIVGFGDYHYTYQSGREGDWFVVGFSPRKQQISLYLACDLAQHEALLARLGKIKHGKGCLYIKRLSDIDLPTLAELIQAAMTDLPGQTS